jgi:hypothetical protein
MTKDDITEKGRAMLRSETWQLFLKLNEEEVKAFLIDAIEVARADELRELARRFRVQGWPDCAYDLEQLADLREGAPA